MVNVQGALRAGTWESGRGTAKLWAWSNVQLWAWPSSVDDHGIHLTHRVDAVRLSYGVTMESRTVAVSFIKYECVREESAASGFS